MSPQPVSNNRFIACGMYAFNPALQRSWRELFDHFRELIDLDSGLQAELDFRHGDEALLDPALFLGHTCGYPLVTRFKDKVTPLGVPCFDVPGTDGKLYSSHLIVNADSDLSGLPDCEGKVAAINTTDSNSGMNLLRYEVARIGAGRDFFSRIDVTGGHLHSLQAVAEGRADIAAIDCVTYQMIADESPELLDRIRRIGFTEKTCGLPFVLPERQATPDLIAGCREALHQAVLRLSDNARSCLHLRRFEAVSLDDYASILNLENYALERGFDFLN